VSQRKANHSVPLALLDIRLRGEFAFLEEVLDVQADVPMHSLAWCGNERHGVATSGADRHSRDRARVAARKEWPPRVREHVSKSPCQSMQVASNQSLTKAGDLFNPREQVVGLS
jgi:hypothetical protein